MKRGARSPSGRGSRPVDVSTRTDLAPAWRAPLSQGALASLTDYAACGANRSMYQLADAYYRGQQSSYVADRQQEYLEASGLRFCENVCDTVVDTMVERLAVAGFVGDGAEAAEDIWRRNKGARLQNVVHTQALVLGDYGVMLDYTPEDGVKLIGNHPSHLRFVYDTEDAARLDCVVKQWRTSRVSPTNPNGLRIYRANVFYEDRIEKYWRATKDGVWYRHLDGGDLLWPVPWTTTGSVDGEPLGIPAVHFRNKSRGATHGVSELAKVIPLQDQLNKHLIDLNDVMDYQGWPQRWATGISADETGAVTNTPGEILTTTNEAASFGAFPMADVNAFIRAIESDYQRIAGLTRTPMRFLLLSGGAPSGESVYAADIGLVGKLRDRQIEFGDAWSELLTKAVALDAARTGTVAGDVEVSWEAAAIRDPAAEWELARAQQDAGVSVASTLRERGYDPDVEAVLREDEAVAAAQRQAGMLNRGIV